MKFLLSIFLFSFVNINSYAQSNATTLVNYTKENGLPSNETYCVIKDKKGYLWIGTDRGVVRYNGNKFQKFDLPDNVVFKIKEAEDGKIWFFTFSGKLAYFWNEKIYPYKFNDSIQKYITKILIDDAYLYENGDIYLKSLLENDYLLKSDGRIKSFTCKKFSSGEHKYCDTISINNFANDQLFIQVKGSILGNNFTVFKDLINNKVYTQNQSSAKKIAITRAIKTSTNDIIFFQKNQVYKIVNSKLQYIDLQNEIISMTYNTKTKTILIGLLKNGIVELNESLQILKKYKLNNYSISSICSDVDNSIWATSLEKGIFQINTAADYNSNLQFKTTTQSNSITLFNNKLLFCNNKGIFSLSNNYKESLILRYPNPKGSFLTNFNDSLLLFCCLHDTNSKVLRLVKRIKGITVSIVNNENNVRIYEKQYYLYYNNGGLIKYKISIPNNSYGSNSSLNIDSIFTYIKNVSIIDLHIRDAVIYNDSTLLIGTLNGLYSYNTKTNNREQFLQNNSVLKFGVNQIESFTEDIYAYGIRRNGLLLLKDTSSIVHITEKQGLLNNSIRYIYHDSNKLWLATDNGISCITFQSLSPVKYTIKNFGKEVGLGNEIIYQIIRFKKDILAATSKGIFKIANADSLLALPPKPIPFYITTIATYLGDTSNITNISLPHNKNRISINFDAIEFTAPLDIEYYYRIVNSDSTWFNISNPQLILQDLSPGTYTVEIKATLPKQGRTSQVRLITITVEKPWWLKTISLVAFALGLASLLYLFTNWRIKKAKKTAQDKNEIATKMLKLEQTALQAQMNPHFIFNCLTGIQQLMNTNNIDEANEYLVTFSRLIRSTLENSTQEFIVLQDEIDYLKRYISLEEKRLTNELQTSFTIADNINTQSIEIPNMMLQPIIENAIRHGIKALENKAGKIAVNLKLINNTIQCIVEDNGIGREAAAQNKMQGVDTHKSFGLAIIKQRLQGYSKSYNQNFSIEVIDLQNENNIALGTKVILHLPIKN